MNPARLFAVVVLLSGCRETRFDETVEVDMTAVVRAVYDGQRGDFTYRALGGSTARVGVSSWGRGGKAARATRNEAGNTWDVEASGSDLVVVTNSEFVRAGVDVTIDGPDLMDVQARAHNGVAELGNPIGLHDIEADGVTGSMTGEALIRAGGEGVDLNITPFDDSSTLIEAEGNVVLRLPPFAPYDIRVVGEVADSFRDIDLGFDEVVIGDGFAEAWRFPRTARLDIYVTNGVFEMREGR